MDLDLNPIEKAHDLGVRSSQACIAGFASVLSSLTAWLVSRGNKNDDRAQSDRWGIFIGHWAPILLRDRLRTRAGGEVAPAWTGRTGHRTRRPLW